MCGIAGIFDFKARQPSREMLERMLLCMKHRGPDDSGLLIDGSCAVGQVRLSIIDLSERGHQPMYSNSGRLALVFNGEIYNYLELKAELSSTYVFRTGTDSEVILAAYEKWGEKCVERFNGMWSFCILDISAQSLFISRDRYGVKPLYYYRSAEFFVFASEIKAIQDVLKAQLTVNNAVVFEYLIYNRTDQSCETFIKEIRRVQHGTNIFIQGSSVSEKRWYNLRDHLSNPFRSSDEYFEVLKSAVEVRLRSDVPLGVCLSGGLDSSAVTSIILNSFQRQDLHAFSAVYGEKKRGDESEFIREYKHLPNLHYVYPTAESFHEDFKSFMDCHLEPVHTMSIYSQFKVLKEASNYVTVALDGQGADEQLAGYHYFFGSYFRELLTGLRLIRLYSEAISYYRKHRSKTAFIYMMFYLLPNSVKNFIGKSRIGGINPEFFSEFTRGSSLAAQLYDPGSLNESLIQHFEYKLEHNLKWNDLNSMYFSMELREPFLDYRLVERTLATEPQEKIHKGFTKEIMRRAMRGKMPEKIRLRMDKVGFDNPSDEWMKTGQMRTYVGEALSSNELRDSGFFDIAACRKRYLQHLKGELSISKEIWKWISMYHFLRKIKNPSV